MRIASGFLLAVLAVAHPCARAQAGFPNLSDIRRSPSDLEIAGDITGLPAGGARYLARADLLALPQEKFTVRDDRNFDGPTRIGGVSLRELARRLAPKSNLVIAICDDAYRANYPLDYILAHRPVLVLTVNGKPPSEWPKDAEDHSAAMGPFMITHPGFTPLYHVLSHREEAQIPWGVVRLEFRDQASVFAAIAPRGPLALTPDVQSGFRIAQQNCFRCHNAGAQGGQKSGRPWEMLSHLAASSPRRFAEYIHDPMQLNSHAQMPGSPDYDEATLHALVVYFQALQTEAHR